MNKINYSSFNDFAVALYGVSGFLKNKFGIESAVSFNKDKNHEVYQLGIQANLSASELIAVARESLVMVGNNLPGGCAIRVSDKNKSIIVEIKESLQRNGGIANKCAIDMNGFDTKARGAEGESVKNFVNDMVQYATFNDRAVAVRFDGKPYNISEPSQL